MEESEIEVDDVEARKIMVNSAVPSLVDSDEKKLVPKLVDAGIQQIPCDLQTCYCNPVDFPWDSSRNHILLDGSRA